MRWIKWLLIVALYALSLRPVLAQAPDLQSILAENVGADDPGMVLLVSTPEGTWAEARGLADLEKHVPIKTTDHFRIASLSKPFTAVVTLQLAEEGLLKLDDPISQYVPDEIVQNIANAEQITIRQLLNMTSGIFNYTESEAYSEAVDQDPTHAWTAAETIAFAYGQEPYFAPGEGYYYSNTNYNLLGLIIEKVTQSTLSEQVAKRIFQPVGMKNTWVESPDQLGVGLVRGYSDQDGDGKLDDVTLINDGVGLGDGGIISTAADLALFPRALFGGKLLKPASLKAMMTWVDDGEGGLYGLGLGYDKTDFGDQYGHSGASSGFQSNLAYLPDADVVVVVLTNNFDSELVQPLTEAAISVALPV